MESDSAVKRDANGYEIGFIRPREVERLTSLDRRQIYRRMADGTFPENVRLGERSVAWRRADVDQWMANPAGWREPAAVANAAASVVPTSATSVHLQD